MSRIELLNTLTETSKKIKGDRFGVILMHKNFYTKKKFIDIITTTDTQDKADQIAETLKTQYAKELRQAECKIAYITI